MILELLYLASQFVTGAVVGAAVGGAVGLVFEGIISFLNVEDEVENRALEIDDAFKWKIKSAKQNKVDVGIFDRNTNQLETLEFTSEEGISSDVKNKVGVWQYL